MKKMLALVVAIFSLLGTRAFAQMTPEAAMNVYKNEYLPLERELKQTYAEMYKLTGDPSFEALTKVPETAADYYLSAADYIDWYNEDPEKL